MNLIKIKKEQVQEYARLVTKIAMDPDRPSYTVSAYDIKRYSSKTFDAITSFKQPILDCLADLTAEYEPAKITVDDDSIKFMDRNGTILHEFSFIVSHTLAFSGTIGINDIKRDGGLNKHIQYLSMFFDDYELNHMKNMSIDAKAEARRLMEFYKEFYKRLAEHFESSPMSVYKLLTGIKQTYNLPDNAIVLHSDGYEVLDFTKVNNPDFINRFDEFLFSNSDTTPLLKIEFQGRKILHIRTKTDKKNSGFKLRFFIETSTNFFNIFNKDKHGK